MAEDRARSLEELIAENESLRGENSTMALRIESLVSRIAELEKRLGRNSQNSSLPPSSDLFGRAARPESPNRAARRAMGRKPGKQPGSEGKHLAAVENPDEVRFHPPSCCTSCGEDLRAAFVERVEVRQVVEIPEPAPVVTEHRVEHRRCGCGTLTKGVFPNEARGPVSYGPRTRARGLYLLARQHLPFERAAEAMADLFGVKVSTGFLDALYSEGADVLSPFLDEVLAQLLASPVVHMDETSDKVAKTTAWFHVACNDLLTLLHADVSRGRRGVEATGVMPSFTGVAVHDRLGLYFTYDKATHGLCGAHLLRNLASVASVDRQAPWARSMAALLLEIKHAGEVARDAGKHRIAPRALSAYLASYDVIVAESLAANPAPLPPRKRNALQRESFNLAVAFATHKGAICRFATDLRVPFSNNTAERDLRMVKLHKKISACFRSMEGARRLAAVRSYLSTAAKHGLDPLEVLTKIFEGNPWVPVRT